MKRRRIRLLPMLSVLLLSLVIAVAVSAATIKSPYEAFKAAHPEIGGLGHEEAVVYFVNSEGELLKGARITQGRKDGIYYVPWELLFEPLLPKGTSKIYLIHNHPSGNPVLSDPDIELGSFWAQEAASRGLDMDLLAITNSNGYTSLQETGRILSPEELGDKGSNYLSYVVQPGLKILGSGFTKVFADNAASK